MSEIRYAIDKYIEELVQAVVKFGIHPFAELM